MRKHWLFAAMLLARSAHAQGLPMRFDFGSGHAAPGYTKVTANTIYTDELGYGFESGSSVRAIDRGGPDPLRGDFITSDKPPSISLSRCRKRATTVSL